MLWAGADAAKYRRGNWSYIRAEASTRPQIAFKNFSGFSQGDVALIQQEIYEFGPYSFDSAQMLLHRGGNAVPLQPRALETLLVLLRRRGEVVSKQELMEAVWPDSFVEEGNLTQNIFLLRKELGKTSDGEDYIQTMPKRGYRMNVPVEEIGRSVGAAVVATDSGLDAWGAPAIRARRWQATQNWLVAAGPLLAMLVVLALGLTAVVLWCAELAQPRVSGYVQITHDGAMKRGIADHVGGPDAALFADGSRVYFMEGTSNAPMIAQVSASGGETGRVPVPFPLPELMDFSPERSELLTGGTVDEAGPLPLWVVPVPAGTAHRLGDISAWDASWSPDGRAMVYARGRELYRARSDGSESKLLVTLPGLGWQPRWSPDGKRLRLTVFDVPTSTSSIWEVSREGHDLHRLLSGWHGPDMPGAGPADGPINLCCGSWAPDGRYFVFQASRGGRSEIWSMPGKPSLLGLVFRSIGTPAQVTNGQLSSLAPVFSPDGRKLFVIGQQLRGELERFDARTGQFVPYLGGVSASFVDFSRDGQWVAYVAYPDGTLWRSRLDGSERLQLTFAPMEAMVPKWSPDGSKILFYGIGAGKEQRDYLISANGGEAKPASAGSGAEMNTSWSPDGESVMYSDFPFYLKEPGKAAVDRLDLKTQRVEKLPGSEGFFAPSWSPDGRYVGAMASDGQRIMLFDFRSRAWTELANGSGLMKWSRDGQYLYYLRYGPEPAVMRVGMNDRQVEEVASLKDVRLAGRLAGLEFGLTPDGAPLILRDIGTQEVYALEWHNQ
jgi:DNA-binding winged helix-turn-helix (wHTH) protein/Tol biopolymer transport system component